MTENEAIKILQEEKTYMDDHAGRAQSEAFQIAIYALEKQIPKKPNKAIDRSWGIENEVNVCPVCDCYLTSVHFISIDENEVKGTDKVAYCETCGQKIDYNE